MKIKLSKSQWESIGKKSGWMKVAEEISPKDLYNKLLQDGKSPQTAALEVLDILTNGAFAAVEEPKRTEMINSVINKFCDNNDDNVSRRRSVKVTFDDGDVVRTDINGTKKEVEDYYMKNEFVKSDEKTMRRGVLVEFLK